MFSTEWKYVFKTKGMLKIILGILLVPTFYAVIFLASMWDPYGSIKHLPVGIVNSDIPIVKGHKTYSLGKKLTHQLVNNHDADFKQVNKSVAKKSLKDGKLYMAITIPKNFSKEALRLGSKGQKTIYFNYHTNAGFSFIAMKMNTTTAQSIQTSVNKQLTTDYLKTINSIVKKTGKGIQVTGNDLSSTNAGLNKVSNGSQTVTFSLNHINAGIGAANAGITQLSGGVLRSDHALKIIPENATKEQQLLTSLAQTYQVGNAAKVKSQELTQALLSQSAQLTNDINSNIQNSSKIRADNAQLERTAKMLRVSQMQAAAPSFQVSNTLKDIGALSAADSTIANGILNGSTQELGALSQVNTGLESLKNATSKVTAGSSKITDNLKTISTDNGKLASGLVSGGKQISMLSNSSNQQLNRIVSPIKLQHTDATHVKNNGTGMAPYLMSVALFVGCITFNIIYDMFTPHKKPKNAFYWWGEKAPFLLEFTLLASTIMYILLLSVDHLEPLQPIKTYLFCVLTMWAFGSIVTFFNLILGKTGAWFMLIFMIIQLGGSAGTYPIQLSNHIFQVIHPYLPMSISIDAFRSTLSIGNSILPETIIFATIILSFNLLMLLTFKLNMHRTNRLPYNE
ncbi:YhgE/Pip domain-containing protein [Lactiplantibacillus plantarum]|nr:YhgE/Pip domain-containing protein [Lactiplantibacillus plantarum]